MSIDVKDLEAELTQIRRKVGDWAASRTHFASELKDQHAAFLADQTDKLNSLRSLQTHLQRAAELTSKRLQNEALEVKHAEERLAGANAEVSTSERQMDISQALLQNRKEHYMRVAEEAERTKMEKKAELAMFASEVDVFVERFGLRFRRAQVGDVSLVMTHVDREKPDAEFCVSVRIAGDGTDMYAVTKCEPLVPDLDELLMTLNQTNDFGAFVKAVRMRFVAIANGSATACGSHSRE